MCIFLLKCLLYHVLCINGNFPRININFYSHFVVEDNYQLRIRIQRNPNLLVGEATKILCEIRGNGGLTKPQWIGPTDNVIRPAGRGIELMFVCLFLVHACFCLFCGCVRSEAMEG